MKPIESMYDSNFVNYNVTLYHLWTVADGEDYESWNIKGNQTPHIKLLLKWSFDYLDKSVKFWKKSGKE